MPSQPYHHDTVGMPVHDAEALVARIRHAVLETTLAHLSELCDALRPQHGIGVMTIRTPPLAFVPVTVAEAHASYAVMCRADGMMYHDALCTAARRLEIGVETDDRGDAIERAAERLAVSVEQIEQFLDATGRRLGPPWRKEHRLATAAAIAALAGRIGHHPSARVSSFAAPLLL